MAGFLPPGLVVGRDSCSLGFPGVGFWLLGLVLLGSMAWWLSSLGSCSLGVRWLLVVQCVW